MDSTRQEYPALLTTLQPDQAINVLNERVGAIGKINADIADWLQERRKIEETYAAALRKLARRPQYESEATMGIFQMPWQRIVSGVEVMAQSHETLAAKIETDVELPLRQYATRNREMQTMGNSQGNLAALAKELSQAQKKADKGNSRGGNKNDGAKFGAEDAAQQWDSQAPYVFEQLQVLDENRINHLRDVLTQFQTHESDQVERNRASAENCLNALLNIETADEIKTFAVRVNQDRARYSARPTSLMPPDGTRPTSSRVVPPTPPPPRHTDEGRRSGSVPGAEKNTAALEPPTSKGKMSGLKRLGTVMGRRKSAVPPPPPGAAEKKKEKSRSFAPFRRGDSSRSFQDVDSPGHGLTPVVSQDERASSRHEDDRPPREESRNEPSMPASTVNGTTTLLHAQEDDLGRLSPAGFRPDVNGNPPTSEQTPHEMPAATSPTATTRDETLLESSTPNEPISPDESHRNLTIRDEPIREDEGEAQQALNNVANQLRLQAHNSGVNRGPGTVRGRRDVRNTMFFPTPLDLPTSATTSPTLEQPPTVISTTATSSAVMPATDTVQDLPVPLKRNAAFGSLSDDLHVGSDTQSIRSAQSLAALPYHPEFQTPGLNASVVETVSTWFSDSGVAKSMVVGEVALAHVHSSPGGSHDQDTVRLTNYHSLEKCAQNPTFVQPLASAIGGDDQAGTYTVALSSIRRSVPTVAFKYQLHVDEHNLTRYSPMLITSAWQVVEGQASIIVMYNLNPAFVLPVGVPDLTLKNVVLSVSIDTKSEGAGKAVNAMMSPTQGASFKKKAGTVTWKLPELGVRRTQERLLVRFRVDGGLARKGNIEVKFEMPEMTASSLGVERLGVIEADPFADEEERKSAEQGDRWEEVPTRRVLVSGRYCTM